jgi:predicted enzyme related to lactoylglutathione lyase
MITPSILIWVLSLDKSKLFYEKVFDIEFEEFRPPFACFSLGWLEFDIEEDADYRSPSWKERYIWWHKSVSFNVENIEDFLRKVTEYGGKIIKDVEEKPRWYKEAKISDLDGNIFIIDQKM